MGKKRTKKIKLTPEEKKERREKSSFKRKIISVFKNSGFEYLPTNNLHRYFGDKKGEIDMAFLYENVILICEDTCTKKERDIKDHLKNKKIFFDEFRKNESECIDWLKEKFKEKFNKFHTYKNNRYKVFYIYIPKYKLKLTPEDKKLYSNIKIIAESSLNYFKEISASIKYSAKYDIFRFLNLSLKDIGVSTSSSDISSIEASVIAPEAFTGMEDNIKIVSFLARAEDLMQCSYVLRKDNWEEDISLYQRLIKKNRIEKVREYIAKTKKAFLNNIIVTLPDTARFTKTLEDGSSKEIDIEELDELQVAKLEIPKEINSICIIDGQHRVFSHYEDEDKYERTIKSLRKELHLLTTGIVFPKNMPLSLRRKFEAEIFLDINSNAKPVPKDILLHISSIKDPFSSMSVARMVLKKLNETNTFPDYFQLSTLEKSKIKSPSIIQFVLNYLVDINENKETLFKYWNEKEKKLLAQNNKERDRYLGLYVEYCSKYLENYFRALKSTFNEDWYDENSKILSVTSINGFIISLRHSLEKYGLKDYEFYKDRFSKLKINFNKDKFEFTSSQYHKFAEKIRIQCFND
ncbi:MAG: DGQHR domain-containing protein [Nanoarchaeota archaeon]